VTDEAPSTYRSILRELPRRKVALVLLVVVANLGVVAWLRGRAIALERPIPCGLVTGPTWQPAPKATFVPPWSWTAQEWRETFLWK
jgi:hypothetical protein